MLIRCRFQLMGDRTRETTRLESMPEDASIKLSAVPAGRPAGDPVSRDIDDRRPGFCHGCRVDVTRK
jgi:hypothetical protein